MNTDGLGNTDPLANLASQGLKVAGGTALVFFAPMLVALAALGSVPRAIQGAPSQVALHEIPPHHLVVMQQVGAATGLPWQVLAAIAKVESDFGANMGPSSAGAVGYCQFMPATWAHYGVDGNGDGIADPYDYRDCLPAAAALLLANGAPDQIRQALYAYNPLWSYVDRVLAIATSYGYLDPTGIPARAVALVRSRIGAPYIWGAAGPDSFDCSGLVQWVYGQQAPAGPPEECGRERTEWRHGGAGRARRTAHRDRRSQRLEGAARLRGQGDDIHDVEEATRQFVEAYGTFDFRDPEAHRERLIALSTGRVFAAVATSPVDPVAIGQQQTVTIEVLTVQVTALSGAEATASATADQTRHALDPATGQLRTHRTRQHVNCRLIGTAGRWLITEFRLVSDEPLVPLGR